MNVSQIIHSQIDKRVFMSLGASDFGHLPDGLIFNARILPMTKKGRGTRARVMTVMITLDPSDTYNVKVSYAKGRFDRETHFEETQVFAHNLDRLLLSLDYDGSEVTNPRYWHSV